MTPEDLNNNPKYKEFYKWCLKTPREGMIIKNDKAYFVDTSLVGTMYKEYEKSIL